jgi:hypothetical protein
MGDGILILCWDFGIGQAAKSDALVGNIVIHLMVIVLVCDARSSVTTKIVRKRAVSTPVTYIYVCAQTNNNPKCRWVSSSIMKDRYPKY